jgi:hypothetical protein
MADRIGERFLEYAEGGSGDVIVNGMRDARHDGHRDTRDGRHAARLVFNGATEIAMIESRRTQPRGDAAHRGEAEVDLPDS